MKVEGKHYRTVWFEDNKLFLIDQNRLPFFFEILETNSYTKTCTFIKEMNVRGAGAIGTTAAFAMALAALEAPESRYLSFIEKAKAEIEATRPTARNLFYATEKVFIAAKTSAQKAIIAAQNIAEEDIAACKKIGEFGSTLIENGWTIETHCNAGWLAFTDIGSALAPIYEAHKSGKKINVLVDETRPRNQGAKLTAWELLNEDIPFAIIPDNAGAFLMSRGKVNMMIVGADRIAANGDTANKIGTFEKAIVAKELGIPFYIAAPSATIDFACKSGEDIPIEYRNQEEVLFTTGLVSKGHTGSVLCAAPGSFAVNPAFDVTPAKYITGIITEKGIFKPNELDSI